MEKPPVIVIPSYWCKGSVSEEDTVYDHPTDLLLESGETITRTLKSFNSIESDFEVLIIGASTRPSIGKEMDEKLVRLISDLKLPYPVNYFGHGEYTRLIEFLSMELSSELVGTCSNIGYGNIRNLCLLIPHLLGYNTAILIDDDEIITDPDFVSKTTDFVGKEFKGKIMGLILGFYRNEDGSFYSDESAVPWWELVWNKPQKMNEAFKIIENDDGSRLVDTPFAFGGNMVIHRKCWIKVPFDPLIARGEDMDYLRNVKYHGFAAKLDRSLSITHLPPISVIDYDRKFRQDVYRFLYAQAKLADLGIDPGDYDPYPGYFLTDTGGKVMLTELLSSLFKNQGEFMKVKNSDAMMEKLHGITGSYGAAKKAADENKGFYRDFQSKWEEFMGKIPPDIPFTVIRRIND